MDLAARDGCRWEVVAMLWAACFLHQADRHIYSVVLDPLRADLGLSGYEAGLISSAFTIVVAVLSPLAGALGDRLPKHRVLVLADHHTNVPGSAARRAGRGLGRHRSTDTVTPGCRGAAAAGPARPCPERTGGRRGARGASR